METESVSPRWRASPAKRLIVELKVLRRSNGLVWRLIFPDAIREKSRMSEMMRSRDLPDKLAVRT